MRRLRKIGVLAALLVLCSLGPAAGMVYNEVLDRGLRNDEPYSYALAQKARETKNPEKQKLLEEAVAMSPDVPGLHFRLALASLPSPKSMGYVASGIKAYWRSFWWTFDLTGLFYISLFVSFVIAVFVTLTVRIPQEIPLIAHDVAENRAKILIFLILPLVSMLGLVGFMAGCVFLISLRLRKADRMVFVLVSMILILAPVLVPLTNTFLTASTPQLRAIVDANEGRDVAYPIEVLAARDDFESRFSYALALKKAGRYDEAISINSDLLKGRPDQKLYINLGNNYAILKQTELAKEAYGKALELGPSVVALYNMSQVYRDVFDYPNGDKYFKEASAIDLDKVAAMAATAGETPNRFVVDETLTKSDFSNVAFRYHKEALRAYPVHPGLATAAGVFLFLLYILLTGRKTNWAYRCSRCGDVACGKCTTGKGESHMCHDCYRSLVKMETINPKDRVSKILAIREKKSRLLDTVRLLSFFPPGIAHVYAGRPLSGLVLLWLFFFTVVTAVLTPFLKTGMLGLNHGIVRPGMIFLALMLYVLSNISLRRRLERGWL